MKQSVEECGYPAGTVPPITDPVVTNVGSLSVPCYRAQFQTAFLVAWIEISYQGLESHLKAYDRPKK